MNLTKTPSSSKQPELKGYHVLLCMLVFFGCMFAVNGTFLYYAITTFPGEDIEKSYLQGLHYNDSLEARARQAELGWTAAIGLDEAQTMVLVRIQGSDENDLAGLSVTGTLRHLASRTGDQLLNFEQRPDGLYAANIEQPDQGTWSVTVTASQSANTPSIFEAVKELRVR